MGPSPAPCRPVGGGAATRTGTPSVIESGGFTTTASPASMPDSTSMVLPKSRPCTMLFNLMRCWASTVATCSPAERNSTVLAGKRSDCALPGSLKCTSAYAPGKISRCALSSCNSTCKVRSVGSSALEVRTAVAR